MGKYDKTFKTFDADLFNDIDYCKVFWMYKIANEMAEHNRLIRQGQCILPDEVIDVDENVDKA
jgi:hypothetical protein